MTRTHRIAATAVACFLVGLTQPWRLVAQGQAVEPAKVKYAQIKPAELQEWLTYLSSDALQGRQIFTEGYGLAASYVADHLRAWGVKPLGDAGTYFEPVKLKSYRVTRNSSVAVTVGGQTRTFKHGDHVTFAVNSGGKQALTFTGAEFIGYGAVNAAAQYDDFKGRDVKGKLVVAIAGTPAALAQAGGGGGRGGRGGGGAYAITTLGAKAFVSYGAPPTPPTAAQDALTKAQAALAQAAEAVTQAQQAVVAGQRGAGAAAGGRGAVGPGGARGGGATAAADITSVLNVEAVMAPQFTADDTFYEFLFSAAPTKFAEIKAKAEKGEPLAAMSLSNVTVAVNIDNTFDVISEQLSKNVVGMVEGSDPKLKDTYVLFGAHLDHIGYSTAGRGNTPTPTACRQRGPAALAALAQAGKAPMNAGRRGTGVPGGAPAPGGAGGRGAAPPAPAVPFDQRDIINNGADDDGSGSTAALAIAKAFATGPKPKRSVVFVWHTGEEAGLYGSRYNADFPIVPLDKVQVQLNMDMIGRDDCNNLEGDYTNTLFIVGADRISTDLHNIVVLTNNTLAKPLTLDYELNDANDPENIYTRSDHYSYASKGVPIAFFTTGLHPDYHRVTDTVDKILFPKMARITQLVYEAGFSIANSDRVLERDNKGPRTGFSSKAEILKK